MRNKLTKIVRAGSACPLFAAAILALAITFTLSCSSGDGDGGTSSGCPNAVTGNGTVSCGGQTYKTVVIGTQTWMAENLNYNTGKSKCYGEGGRTVAYDRETDNDNYITLSPSEIQANCTKYGRLYDWTTAMALPASCNSSTCTSQVSAKHQGICPSGWHIPSNAEWDKLYRYADGNTVIDSCYNSETAGRYLKATSGWNEGGNGQDTYEFSALPGGSADSDGIFKGTGAHGVWWSSSSEENRYADLRFMRYDIEGAGWNALSKMLSLSIRCIKD